MPYVFIHFPDRRYLLQAGISVYGKAPSLVIGQMPVEEVEANHRHQVDDALELADRHEVSAHIYEETPVSESGVGIVEFTYGNLSVEEDLQLPDVSQALGGALTACSTDGCMAVSYAHAVAVA